LKTVDHLLSFLPPALLLLAQDIDDVSAVDTNPDTAQAALQSLDLSQKKDILRRVLRSPQFTQSLGSLTVALRDGGLPSISEALKIPVENGGFMRRGGVPLGGGDAVEAFLEGIRRQVKEKGSNPSDRMETD
jgi:26S proteasome regulatory subunit N13